MMRILKSKLLISRIATTDFVAHGFNRGKIATTDFVAHGFSRGKIDVDGAYF